MLHNETLELDSKLDEYCKRLPADKTVATTITVVSERSEIIITKRILVC